jgi:hypothetical protein
MPSPAAATDPTPRGAPAGGILGHCWQSALFPSGRAFGYIAYPPRPDGQPTFNEGYLFAGDGELIPARVVEAPWLTKLQPLGEDVSVVLQTADGTVRIEGETVVSTHDITEPSDIPADQLAKLANWTFPTWVERPRVDRFDDGPLDRRRHVGQGSGRRPQLHAAWCAGSGRVGLPDHDHRCDQRAQRRQNAQFGDHYTHAWFGGSAAERPSDPGSVAVRRCCPNGK